MASSPLPRSTTWILVALLVLIGGGAAWLFLFQRNEDSTGAALARDAAAAADAAARRDAAIEAGDARPAGGSGLVEAQRNAIDGASVAAFDLAEALWLEGKVLVPAGAPADDSLEVVLRVRKADAAPQARAERGGEARGNADALAAALDVPEERTEETLEPEWEPDPPQIVSRAAVGPEGGFRIAAPRERTDLELALDARFLYLEAPLAIAELPDPLVLEARLGACVRGRLVAARAADGSTLVAQHEADGALVTLARVEQSFERLSSRSYWSAPRRVRAAADGAFELRAVPAPGSFSCTAKPHAVAAAELAEFPLVPGELRELEIPLMRGATVRGIVRDDEGKPIPRAKVTGVRFGGNMMALAGSGGSARRVLGADDGTFTLTGLPPGRMRVIAERRRFLASLGKSVDLADGETVANVELVLERGGVITGRVVWPDQSPAVGARVEADLDPSQYTGMGAMTAWRGRSSRARAASDGTFELLGLGSGPFGLSARGSREQEGVRSSGAAHADKVAVGTRELVVVLQPTRALAGRVVDSRGEPYRAFTIEYEAVEANRPFWLGPASASKQSFKDVADGGFAIADLAAGRWKFRAEVAEQGRSEYAEVDLVEAAPAPLVLVVKAAASAAGLVVAPDGSPVAGARVRTMFGSGPWATMQMGAEERPETVSDAQGRFELRGLDVGRMKLAAASESWAPSETIEIELAEGQALTDLRLQLRVGGRILGTVHKKDGQPSAGRSVMANNTTAGDSKMTSSDAEGRFEIAHVRPGSWQVISMGAFDQMFDQVSKSAEDGKVDPAAWMNEMQMAMVEVEDGKDTHVALGAPPADPIRVHGRIVAGKEGVQALATFLAEGGSALSSIKLASANDQGEFEIVLEKPGQYTISVQQLTDGMGRQNTIEFSREIPKVAEHELVLELPLGSISGTVLGADNQPVEGVRVSLSTEGAIQAGFLTGGQYNEIVTNARGEYRLPWLRAGTYTIGAGGSFFGGLLGDRASHGRAVRTGIALADGQNLEGIDFRLGGAGEIHGRVLDARGEPVEAAAVFVRDEDGRLLERVSMTMSDSAGRYTITGIGEGEYTLSARQGQLASIEGAAARVRAGEKTEADVRMQPATMLLISLVDEDDKPTRAAVVVLDSAGRQVNGMLSFQDMVETMQKGFTSLEQRVGPLAPGSYKVTATAANGVSKTKPVTLNGQPERSLRIKLKE
ncbi:MAG: hypothetical protein EPO68_15800 [Planctomycetota bacterium]|nr:MAG: hypothetical protein EPO68_15800 [Planctomycetota bacterium]